MFYFDFVFLTSLFSQFEAISAEYDGIEFWGTRELQVLLGYIQWRNFTNTIAKPKILRLP
jgi:DNA-damage-inducible protein D